MSPELFNFINSEEYLRNYKNKMAEEARREKELLNKSEGEIMDTNKSLNTERQQTVDLVNELFANPAQTKQLIKHLVDAGREALDAVDNVLKTNYIDDTLRELSAIPAVVKSVLESHEKIDTVVNQNIRSLKKKEIFVKTAITHPVYVGTAKLAISNCKKHLKVVENIMLSIINKEKANEQD